MALLSDVDHYFGSDVNVSVQGDLNAVSSTVRAQQRVLRRLLTNPGGDIFAPTYGAGLPQWIGKPLDVNKIQALCVSQLLLESVVAPTPTPVVTVSQSPGDLTKILVNISFNVSPTSQPVTLSFTVS